MIWNYINSKLRFIGNLSQLDLASSDFLPASPEAPKKSSLAFITSASTTLKATRTALRELRETAAPAAVASSTSAAAIAAPTIPCSLPKAHIGIADDDATVRRTLSERYLTDFKIGDIELAIDGKTVIDDLLTKNGHELEILFLDNSMPIKTGIEVIKFIRSNPVWTKIVVIFLTSDSSFDSTYETLGFDGYLVKPASKQAISQCLNEVFMRLSSLFDPADERRWITNNLKK